MAVKTNHHFSMRRWILGKLISESIRESTLQEFEERYLLIIHGRNRVEAMLWYWFQIVFLALSNIITFMRWGTMMLKSYLKMTWRTFQKQKGFSFINISGLAIGLTCVLFIMLYVSYEKSFDNYHENGDSVFRIAMEFKTRTTESLEAMTYGPMVPLFKKNYSSVSHAARVRMGRYPLVKNGNRVFYEHHQMYTESDLFRILSIPFIEGNPETSLDRPHTVVITQAIAQKYFGTMDILGKTIEIDRGNYEITGIVKDSPGNTHLKYEIIQSFKEFEGERWPQSWSANMVYNYIRLHSDGDRDVFEQQIRKIADQYQGERLKALGYSKTFFLQRIRDIHLYSHLREEMEPPGNPLYLLITSAVGVLILLIACLNFVNLSTALSTGRTKEVGLRKVVGARRGQLIVQFMGDSMCCSFLAFGLGLIIAGSILPYFNILSGMDFTLRDIYRFPILLRLMGITMVLGIAAGIYPAIFLSRFRAITTLTGPLRWGNRSVLLRRFFVMGQFTVSIVLIICTLLSHQQINFMKQQHLGFNPEQRLVIALRGGIPVSENYDMIKNEFVKHPNIIGASVTSNTLGNIFDTQYIYRLNETDNRRQVVSHFYVDTEFIPLYGIEMAAGRPFQSHMYTDPDDAVIVNESAALALGYPSPQQAIGKLVESGPDGNRRHIIGVTKDFHYRGLNTEIGPLVMKVYPSRFSHITLLLKTSDLNDTMVFVRQQLDALFPDNPLESFFLDAHFNSQYQKDEQVGRLFSTLSALALIIAAMGLLGLISFSAVQRKKEIGIRKVLGSPVSGIVFLLTKEFAGLVLISNIIAWPVAYVLVKRWLMQFPYRTGMGIELFILSAIIALLIGFLSMGYQAVKASLANPAEVLKVE